MAKYRVWFRSERQGWVYVNASDEESAREEFYSIDVHDLDNECCAGGYHAYDVELIDDDE